MEEEGGGGLWVVVLCGLLTGPDQVLPVSYYAVYLVVDISFRNTNIPMAYVTWKLVFL